ncbi:MAG: hypothetical protein IPL62_16965 [Caulobacteraceae bacterium]|nr:hypothetical protein [Caulobacteraceae bacterium]MBK8545077.1 hypothetical protein [Caulobacteraceae bacterium]
MTFAKSAGGWLFSALVLLVAGFAGEAFAQSRPYDIASFDVSLRTAVETARSAQTRAIGAAGRAQFDMTGTVRFKGTAGDSYEGEGYGSGDSANRHGYGLITWNDGEFYAGQNRGGTPNAGVKEGYGVYVFADGRIYEGQWFNDLRHGYGVQWDPGGQIQFAGTWNNGDPPR